MKLQINQQAPEFSLPDQSGKLHTLFGYKGKWVLIYFYPKDGTIGCTKEACTLRDNFPHFQNSELTILGISTDSVASHKKIAEKYQLPFALLSDEQKIVVKLYDVWHPKKFMGKEYMGTNRTSFLLNPEGEIIKIYEKVKPEIHAEQVLKDIKELQAGVEHDR